MSHVEELVALKKATACSLYLDKLQAYLIAANMGVVKCGCDHCLGGSSGDNNVEYLNVSRLRPDLVFHSAEARKYKRTVFGLTDDEPCRLYEWFKARCVEFDVPAPDDKVDHPAIWPDTFQLTTCLGRGLGESWSRAPETFSWRNRVKQLPYAVQIKTLYQMIHAIVTLTQKAALDENKEEPMTFQDWFKGPKATSLLL